MASWLASAAAAIGLAEDETPPHTPKNALTPAAVEAGLAEMTRLLDGTDTEALLRAGGEQGLPPVGGGLGDATYRRWLLAEKGDAVSAAARLMAHAVWRAEYVPNGAIAASEVAAELAANKAFVQGADADGRPVIFVRVANHRRARGAAARVKRFICWVLDVAAATNDPAVNPSGKMVGVFDMRGIAVECLDAGALKSIFELLQAHFPERLAVMTFVDAPLMFWAVWRVVCPFVDPVTRAKVQFASAAEVAASLPPAVAPTILGGTAPLVPVSEVAERVGLLPRGAAAAAVAAVPAEDDAAAGASGDGGEDADLDAAVAAELAAARAAAGKEGGAAAAGAPVVVATAGVVTK